MDKFLITPRASNKKLGPIMVTTSARASCPTTCPLSRRAKGPSAGTCYAEQGFIGAYLWANLDRVPVGGSFRKGRITVRSFDEVLRVVRTQAEGAIWRHNQAGDLASDDGVTINREKLQQLTDANKGRCGFTFTHYLVLKHSENQNAVREANREGFAVNISTESLEEADAVADLNIGPVVTLLPAGTTENAKTPKGRTVAICPAISNKEVTCASCRICTTQRKAIIGFPAIGRYKHKIGGTEAAGGEVKRPGPPQTPLDAWMTSERDRLEHLRYRVVVERREIDTTIATIEAELVALHVYTQMRGMEM